MATPPADPDRASQFESLERAIRTLYTWTEWYRTIPDAKQATLVIEQSDHMSLYRPKRDTLCLYVTDDQLGEEAVAIGSPWPTWKVELVHEMLHEWEQKGTAGSSAAGEALWHQHPRRFQPDHQAAFFTAIVDKAPYFHLTPEEFIATL